MDLTPFKPKSTIPSHLTDEPSPLGVSTDARDKKERDSLYTQIENLDRGRQVVSFNEPSDERYQIIHGDIDVEGYKNGAITRTPLATSHEQSPYTQHPTIDFDNLSWPSG
jgi:GTP cyclohydrolase I